VTDKTLEQNPKPVEIMSDQFKKEVLDHKGAVLIEFWAPGCGHCRRFAPILDELTAQRTGSVKVVTIDIDKNEEFAKGVGISGTPTLALFNNGEHVKAHSGAMKKDELDTWIDELLKN
jgi:thioredoxin 1